MQRQLDALECLTTFALSTFLRKPVFSLSLPIPTRYLFPIVYLFPYRAALFLYMTQDANTYLSDDSGTHPRWV